MEKRGQPANNPDSLGALWLIRKLTSGGVCCYPPSGAKDILT